MSPFTAPFLNSAPGPHPHLSLGRGTQIITVQEASGKLGQWEGPPSRSLDPEQVPTSQRLGLLTTGWEYQRYNLAELAEDRVGQDTLYDRVQDIMGTQQHCLFLWSIIFL